MWKKLGQCAGSSGGPSSVTAAAASTAAPSDSSSEASGVTAAGVTAAGATSAAAAGASSESSSATASADTVRTASPPATTKRRARPPRHGKRDAKLQAFRWARRLPEDTPRRRAQRGSGRPIPRSAEALIDRKASAVHRSMTALCLSTPPLAPSARRQPRPRALPSPSPLPEHHPGLHRARWRWLPVGEPDDATELLRRVADGDDEALRELYRRHSRLAYLLAFPHPRPRRARGGRGPGSLPPPLAQRPLLPSRARLLHHLVRAGRAQPMHRHAAPA